jgi:hypothetical protein
MTESESMKSLAEQVMKFNIKCIGAQANPQRVGMYVLAQLLPDMEKNREDKYFTWAFQNRDLAVYTQREYDTEIEAWRKKGIKCDAGRSTWFYDFKGSKGKLIRANITTEVWYIEGENYGVSPFAIVLGQHFADGFHICKVTFCDV